MVAINRYNIPQFFKSVKNQKCFFNSRFSGDIYKYHTSRKWLEEKSGIICSACLERRKYKEMKVFKKKKQAKEFMLACKIVNKL